MYHEIDIEKAELRCGCCFVDFEESLLVVDRGVLIEPCFQVLHRSESEREGVGRLSPNEWMERRRLLDRGHCAQKAVPPTDIELMQ